MICQLCGQEEASLRMTRTVNGQKQTLALCPQCAAQSAWQTKQASSLWDSLFESFLPGSSLFAYPAPAKTPSAPLVCPGCGETESQLQETGLLGCAHCYETFAALLDPVFGRLHGHRTHPVRPGPQAAGKGRDKREDLRHKLAQAIECEAYEEAARLRDEIRDLDREGSVEEG